MFGLRPALSFARGLLNRRNPVYVQYYIIAQCHLACQMCNIVEANSDLVPVRLEDVERIARNLRAVGASVVLLTGGEPFLHRELPEIVRIMVKHGLSPRLQTAGLATREQLLACYEAGARHINVSLDSLCEEKQDHLNGDKRGSWRAALECMARINEIYRSPRRLCALGCVLSRLNFEEIPALLEFATQLGWWLSLVPVHITELDRPRNFRGTNTALAFGPQDHARLDALLARLLAMKRSHLLFDSEEFLRSTVSFLKGEAPTWRRFNGGVCDTPDLYFAVLPNGDLAACCDHRLQRPLSLLDADFPRAFRSPTFRSQVLKIATGCEGCNYGSYPEITLLARDRRAFLERLAFFVGRRRPRVPRLSSAQTLNLAHSIREAHGVQPFTLTQDTPRPAASSQRYEGDRVLDRSDAVREWSSQAGLLKARGYGFKPRKRLPIHRDGKGPERDG